MFHTRDVGPEHLGSAHGHAICLRTMNQTDPATQVLDMAAHEQTRFASVLAASTDLDPGAVLAGEAEAHRMLYSGLDAEQQAVHRMLVEAGVLDA